MPSPLSFITIMVINIYYYKIKYNNIWYREGREGREGLNQVTEKIQKYK